MKAHFGLAHENLLLRKGEDIKHLKTDLMVADIPTKPLCIPNFRLFVELLLDHIFWGERVKMIRQDADSDETGKAIGRKMEDRHV